MPYIPDYYDDQQEIIQPVDYPKDEFSVVLRSSLIREAKELSIKYRKRDIQDFVNNVIAYLKVER